VSIVIVEGPDGSGKTTLLRMLREQTKTYFWIASSSGRPKTYRELQDAVHWISQCAYLKMPVVCDRFPLISESVYGPVIRGTSLLDEMSRKEQAAASELLAHSVDRIIYCRPPEPVIRDNIKIRPQMQGVSEKLKELLHRYDDLMDSLRDDNLFVYHYDYTRNNSRLEDIFFGDLKG